MCNREFVRMNRAYSISDTNQWHNNYKINQWHNRYESIWILRFANSHGMHTAAVCLTCNGDSCLFFSKWRHSNVVQPSWSSERVAFCVCTARVMIATVFESINYIPDSIANEILKKKKNRKQKTENKMFMKIVDLLIIHTTNCK